MARGRPPLTVFPTIAHLGPLTLHVYGLLVAVGFLVGLAVFRRTSRGTGLSPADVERLPMVLLVAGLLGARILYFLLEAPDDFVRDPMAFFRVWEGGLVFYGGVIGAFAATVVFVRRRAVRLLVVTDALVPPLLIGHAFGRLGCLAAGCCYGKPAGDWPGIIFTHPESLAPTFLPLLPTQPLEAAALTLLFGVSLWLFRRDPPRGVLSGFYLCAYAAVRFFMEFMRGDDRGEFVHGLSPSQIVALVLFVAGLGVLIHVKKRKRD